MEKIKSYCHKTDCDIVQTGFNVEQYYVCKVCKLEVSESLKNSIKDRSKKSKEREIELDQMLLDYGITMPDDFFDGT